MKIPTKKKDFLEPLDDVNSFVFCPYMSTPKGFASVMFFTNGVCGDDPSVRLNPLSENLDSSFTY